MRLRLRGDRVAAGQRGLGGKPILRARSSHTGRRGAGLAVPCTGFGAGGAGRLVEAVRRTFMAHPLLQSGCRFKASDRHTAFTRAWTRPLTGPQGITPAA